MNVVLDNLLQASKIDIRYLIPPTTTITTTIIKMIISILYAPPAFLCL